MSSNNSLHNTQMAPTTHGNSSTSSKDSIWCLAKRPLPSSKNPHFQNEAKCTTFLVKMSFICMRIKNHFHIKGWPLNLVLIQRSRGIRNWPIVPNLLRDHTFSIFLTRDIRIMNWTTKLLKSLRVSPTSFMLQNALTSQAWSWELRKFTKWRSSAHDGSTTPQFLKQVHKR